MSFVSQKFVEGEYIIEFTEVTNFEDTATSDIKRTVRIYIHKSNSLHSIYQRTFEKKLTPHYFMNFTKKFLENSHYRQQFLFKTTEKEWHGVVQFYDPVSHVQIQCKTMIDDLNSKDNVKFRDMVKLRTFGRDVFSKMSIEELKDCVGQDVYQLAISTFDDSNEAITSLRWMARGLTPPLSIYKVKVDREVNMNKEKSIDSILH